MNKKIKNKGADTTVSDDDHLKRKDPNEYRSEVLSGFDFDTYRYPLGSFLILEMVGTNVVRWPYKVITR